MKNLFTKAAEFTLNNHYKKLLIECSNGSIPPGITCDGSKIKYNDSCFEPKDEKELCSVMLKLFKMMKLEKEELKYPCSSCLYPSECCLSNVPRKSRETLIHLFTIEKMKELNLSEEQRADLYSTIMLGIYTGYIDTSQILVQNYYIIDIPGIIISNDTFFVDTSKDRKTTITSYRKDSSNSK